MMESARMQNVWPGVAPEPADDGGPVGFGDTMSRSGVPTLSDGSVGGPPSRVYGHPHGGIGNGPFGTGYRNQRGFGSNARARPVGSNTRALHQPCDATVGAVPEGKPMLTSILPRGPDMAPTAWVGIGMPSRICVSHLRGGIKRHPSPDGGIVARERAATVPHQGMADVCTSLEIGSCRTPGAAARHNAECRDLPRHSEMVRLGIKHHLSQGGTDACTGRNGIQNNERTGRPNDLWSASYLTGCEWDREDKIVCSEKEESRKGGYSI